MKTNRLNKIVSLSLAGALALTGFSGIVNAKSKQVTLELITWSNAATVSALKNLNTKFTKKYPDIKVHVTDVDSGTYPQLVQTRIAANNADIIAQQQFAANPDYTKGLDKPAFEQYIESGYFLNLTKQKFIDNYETNAVRDSASFKGKVYAVPMSKTSYNGVFYNKAIFKKYGITVPQTWDEFMNICKVLKSKGVAPLTAGGKDSWPLGMAANAIVNTVVSDSVAYTKGLWTGKKKLNDSESQVIFNRLAQIASYYEKGVMGVDYASVPGRFAAGKTAMLQDGAWQAPQLQKANPKLQFGYFPMPSTKKGKDVTQLRGKYDTLFAANAKTGKTDAELKWLAFASEKANYQAFINAIAMEPTMKGVDSDNAFLKSLAPMSKDFKLDFELDFKAPKGIGKFGGFQITQLKALGGTVGTAKELADLAAKDWKSALDSAK